MDTTATAAGALERSVDVATMALDADAEYREERRRPWMRRPWSRWRAEGGVAADELEAEQREEGRPASSRRRRAAFDGGALDLLLFSPRQSLSGCSKFTSGTVAFLKWGDHLRRPLERVFDNFTSILEMGSQIGLLVRDSLRLVPTRTSGPARPGQKENLVTVAAASRRLPLDRRRLTSPRSCIAAAFGVSPNPGREPLLPSR